MCFNSFLIPLLCYYVFLSCILYIYIYYIYIYYIYIYIYNIYIDRLFKGKTTFLKNISAIVFFC